MFVGLWAMVIYGIGWMWMELDCAHDHFCSFTKVAIVSSHADVLFIDRVLVRKYYGGSFNFETFPIPVLI